MGKDTNTNKFPYLFLLFLKEHFKLNKQIKAFLKKIMTETVVHKLWIIYTRLKTLKAKRIFDSAQETPAWLEIDILEYLQQKYSYTPVDSYDHNSLEQRGSKRTKEMINLTSVIGNKMNTFLELGCGDGMVSCGLKRLGKIVTAVDKSSKRFDKRAIREGVKFIEMDTCDLQFKDDTFDVVFSYYAFEHIAKPELAFKEAIRVVKKGGYIYFVFGGLYMSPFGLHAQRVITVPYCQLLFTKEVLNKFVIKNGLGTINYSEINGWSLTDFRKLFNSHNPSSIQKIKYRESLDVSHLEYVDLIMKYPTCFKSKTKYFDNFIFSGIEVLFKKLL